ncbi:MAG: hypothetical protein HFG59_01535 [Lachnospiraceae bacterium]|jgi:hypothetical protein|nr:hypothetical protein [Lachnospiraceae bacterium]
MLLIEPISAITSWEDYEYQGHIALYMTLKKIFDLLQSGKSISGYNLQIEGEEDFSIREDDKYITLHQVKAGAIKLEPNDKFSFIIGILQNKAEYGWFHISNGKKIPIDFVSTTLDYINMLKKQLNKKVIERKEIPATDKEDNYIVLDKVAGNHKKADVYSIIKYASKNSKDIDKIKSTISDINNALDTYKSIMEKRIQIFKKDNPSLNDDEAFVCAHKEKYDNAKEIRRKAYGVIVEILRMERPNYIFVDVDYAALVYDQLMLYMKKRITDFYIEKNKNGKCILTFDEIVEQIVVDYHEKIDTVAYQYFQVLRSIYDAYAEYPSETWNNCTVSNCIDCQDSSVCNLYKQISILHNKSEDDINQIIHNLILKTPQVGKSNNLPQDSLVSHLFLNLLDEIKTLGLEKSNVYEAIKDGIKKYRLTLDSSYSTNEFQQNLQTALKKEADRSVLYECDVLITDRLREEALFYNGSDVHVLTEKELNEINGITSSTVEKIKKDCIRPKIIRLIDKNIALGELK